VKEVVDLITKNDPYTIEQMTKETLSGYRVPVQYVRFCSAERGKMEWYVQREGKFKHSDADKKE
jgi:hypothetical protein